MQINTTARHCELDPEVRRFAHERLEKFERFARDIQEAHVIVTAEGYRHTVENFLPERIQIIAQTELTYLATLPPDAVREAIDRLFQFSMPLIVVCKGLEAPPYLIQRANQGKVPVLRTPLSTTPFIHSLTLYLDHMFAPQTTAHGSLVDVYGCGLLFTGRSAIGKSETALDLVE